MLPQVLEETILSIMLFKFIPILANLCEYLQMFYVFLTAYECVLVSSTNLKIIRDLIYILPEIRDKPNK